MNFTNHLKNKNQSFSNFSKKIEEEGIFPNSFYEDSITLIPKPDKDKKTITMNNDARILNEILAKGIQQHIKRDYRP